MCSSHHRGLLGAALSSPWPGLNLPLRYNDDYSRYSLRPTVPYSESSTTTHGGVVAARDSAIRVHITSEPSQEPRYNCVALRMKSHTARSAKLPENVFTILGINAVTTTTIRGLEQCQPPMYLASGPLIETLPRPRLCMIGLSESANVGSTDDLEPYALFLVPIIHYAKPHNLAS